MKLTKERQIRVNEILDEVSSSLVWDSRDFVTLDYFLEYERSEHLRIFANWEMVFFCNGGERDLEGLGLSREISFEKSIITLKWEDVSSFEELNDNYTHEIEETNVNTIDIDDPNLPEYVLESIENELENHELGRKIDEWYGDEGPTWSDYPKKLQTFLEREYKEYKDEEKKELEIELANQRKYSLKSSDLKIIIDIDTKAVGLEKIIGLGAVVLYGHANTGGTHQQLKSSAFVKRIEDLKRDGYEIIDLWGVFSGQDTFRDFCKLILNFTEDQGKSLIKTTHIGRGLLIGKDLIPKIYE